MKTKKIFIVSLIFFVFISLFSSLNNTTVKATSTLNDGLVGYWDFNEGIGDTVFDGSGFGNNGIITNVTWIDGKYGHALNFSGIIAEKVVIADSSSFDFSKELSLSLWVNFSAFQDWGKIICKSIYNDGEFTLSQTNDGKIHFWINGYANHVYSSNALSLNMWYSIIITVNDGLQKIYINNVLVAELDLGTTNITSTANDVFIGNNLAGGASEFGIIDDVRVYNRSLSAVEVGELYLFDPSAPIATPTPSPTSTPLTIVIEGGVNWNMVLLLFMFFVSIGLCIKRIPILGFIYGFLSIALTGLIFISDASINPFISYFLIIVSFTCLLLNGIELIKK
jgi:hypothetical protein